MQRPRLSGPRERLVLELDLTTAPLTTPPTDPLAVLRSRHRPRLTDILTGLRRAAADDEVAALVVQLGGRGPGLALAQELRLALAAFRRSGKPVLAWAETYGEFAAGNAAYALAAACDEVWCQESGDVGLIGVGAEPTFLRQALDRLGVSVALRQRHEYKNAADMFVADELTPAHREALSRIVESLTEQLVADIATDRGLPPARVRELIDAGPLTPADALAAGLIDHVGYRDEVYAAARRRAGDSTRLGYLHRHRPSAVRTATARLATRHRTVALIHGSGPIALGRSGRGPGGAGMGAATVSAALRVAVRDEDVAAICLRVDSPGGSYAASDTIRREVQQARRAGTPVVVSMGSVAGSGGYFVAMAADRIVALPATLTGSIGVFGGKLVLDRLLDRVGVGTAAVTAGAHALFGSVRRPYSESELAMLDGWLDRVYADFVAKVAADRGLSEQRVDEIARGRVWTGADALERGLVDELGGLTAAVAAARSVAGLPDRDDLADVRPYPRVGPLDRLQAPRSSDDLTAAAAAPGWGPMAAIAAGLGLPTAGPLLMPEVGPLS